MTSRCQTFRQRTASAQDFFEEGTLYCGKRPRSPRNFLTVKVENSPFHYAQPVYKKKCRNWCCKEARSAFTDEQRTPRGTWSTPELLKAVEKGYRIIKIHEVWHFKERKKGLFRDYVNQWLKIKEFAGYPSWADTAEKKVQYVSDYETRQGIKLDPDNIVKNPGRKATAKLMLNSFWGKFGENLNKPQVLAITSPAALFQVLHKMSRM